MGLRTGMSLAFTFPGQGSQHIGMGHALAQAFAPAREVFAEVDDALSQHLSKLMWEGPESDLRLTENAQPALMAVSLAVVRTLATEGGIAVTRARYLAGHSLGEYSALAAAGTFSLADAARLLKLRGQAMQKAVPVGEGAMAALIGVDVDVAADIAKRASAACEGAVCEPANDNAPGQVVVSGAREAVEAAVEIAKDAGARRAMLLPVSAPFHCSLMRPAAEAMEEALKTVRFAPPLVPVVCNVTAAPESSPSDISRLLVEQVTAMVRWRECMLHMAESGITTVYELGAGKVLTGLARRIDDRLEGRAVAEPADIEAVVQSAG